MARLDITVTEKFLVKVAAKPAVLSLWLSGHLSQQESEELNTRILQQLRFLKTDPLFVYIDLDKFQPCPGESLGALQDWLQQMGGQHQLMGVLVGKLSVGMLQFQRLAREASVGDSLVCFKEESPALEFWYSILQPDV